MVRRIGGAAIRFVVSTFADDFGHGLLAAIGGSSVLTVSLLTIWTDFRENPWQWHVAFFGGWVLILYVGAWIAWPTIHRWRASSKAEDYAIAEVVRREIGNDNPFYWPQIISISLRWNLSPIQPILTLDLTINNPTPFDLEVLRESTGAIVYQRTLLAAPSIGITNLGRWWASVDVQQPLTSEALAQINRDGYADLELDTLRIAVRHFIPGTPVNRTTSLMLPENLHITAPDVIRSGMGDKREIAQTMALKWFDLRNKELMPGQSE